ncbi:MAG: hypothetical protein WC636_00070 [Candidatus Margulisiibacteriota bacterium]
MSPDESLNQDGVGDISIATVEGGSLRLYVSIAYSASGPAYGSALFSHISSNETTWATEEGIRLTGISVSRPLRLPAGGWRLYYNQSANAGIISAYSADGLSWEAESGTRIATGGAYDAAVVDMGTTLIFPDGTYRLYYGGSSESGATINYVILSATSADGLTFTKESGVRLASSTGRATHPHVFYFGGQYIMYYSTHQYVYKATSSDGLTWAESGSTGIYGADPFILQLSSGNWRMFYNDYDAGTDRATAYTAIWRR